MLQIEIHRTEVNVSRLEVARNIEKAIAEMSAGRPEEARASLVKALVTISVVDERLGAVLALTDELGANPAAAEMTHDIDRPLTKLSIWNPVQGLDTRRPSDEELAQLVREAKGGPDAIDPESLEEIRREIRAGVAEGLAPLREATEGFASFVRKVTETAEALEKRRRVR